MLEKNDIHGIEVGTVEQFQGKEKPVIIISTVRRGGIGFMQEREVKLEKPETSLKFSIPFFFSSEDQRYDD